MPMTTLKTPIQFKMEPEQEENDFAAYVEAEEKLFVANMKVLADNGIAEADYKALLDFCVVNGELEIVSEPEGDDQDESTGIFKEVFVDQVSVGDSGDSFAGNIYGRFAQKKWLKIPYYC